MSSYFDDCPMISHALHTTSTLACAKGLMSLFVFVFSDEKLAPFGYDSGLGSGGELGTSIDGQDHYLEQSVQSGRP